MNQANNGNYSVGARQSVSKTSESAQQQSALDNHTQTTQNLSIYAKF
jgi:hypothetical protein